MSASVVANSERGGGNLNVVHAAALARVTDTGVRRGRTQDELNVISDGAIAIRNGVIVGVGDTRDVLAEHGADVPTIDAVGKTVMPGLVECHSHPIFDGERHDEYAERLGGASLAEVAAKGGGIWRSVVATRQRNRSGPARSPTGGLRPDPARWGHDARGQVRIRAHHVRRTTWSAVVGTVA